MAVSAALFSWILGCAFKPVKSKKISLDLTHLGTKWENPIDTPRLFLLGNNTSTRQFGGFATALTGTTLLLNTYKYLMVDDSTKN